MSSAYKALLFILLSSFLASQSVLVPSIRVENLEIDGIAIMAMYMGTGVDSGVEAVMSSASYEVTYTSAYTDSEPERVFWGADEELSDDGPPRVIYQRTRDVRELCSFRPHDPDYVPEPIYPEYIPLEDEYVFSVEEQPLPPVDSPTAESPGYVAESDPEEDPEEYEDDESDLYDGPVDYPMDGGRARITVRLQASISLPPEAEVERLLAMPTPSPSPLPHYHHPLQGSDLLGIALTQALGDAVTAHTITSNYHHYHHLYTDHHLYEVGESSTARPTRGRGIDYGFVSTVDAEARRQGISEVGYGIRDTWVDPAEAVPEIAPITVGEVNTRVTELAELYEHDTQNLYALLEDAQDNRTRIS
ncbi:hypothetical protein Tco_0709095 [Tanacetum coccineum]